MPSMYVAFVRSLFVCLFVCLRVLATFSARTRENARSCSDILRTKMSCVIDDNSSACNGDKHEAYDDHPVRVLVCVRACVRAHLSSVAAMQLVTLLGSRCLGRSLLCSCGCKLGDMFVCSAYACAHGPISVVRMYVRLPNGPCQASYPAVLIMRLTVLIMRVTVLIASSGTANASSGTDC